MKIPDWVYDKPGSPYRMWKTQYIFLSLGLVIITLLLAIVTLAQTLDARNCSYAARQYERPTKWDFWAGCYIESNGRYIDLDKYIAVSGDK